MVYYFFTQHFILFTSFPSQNGFQLETEFVNFVGLKKYGGWFALIGELICYTTVVLTLYNVAINTNTTLQID